MPGASPKSCLTWWVERASWWNGHLGGTGILVERASCPFHSQSGCPNTGDRENEGEPVLSRTLYNIYKSEIHPFSIGYCYTH
ncbi:MAG: hypothetical protein F6K02_25340 [Moorea sp. SIO3A5]|nr:hypothetical protein [Moorena sp. SIO3A5]